MSPDRENDLRRYVGEIRQLIIDADALHAKKREIYIKHRAIWLEARWAIWTTLAMSIAAFVMACIAVVRAYQ